MLKEASSCVMCTSSALAKVDDLRLSDSEDFVDLADFVDRRDRLRSRLFVRSKELRIFSTVRVSRFLGNTVSAALRSSSDSLSEGVLANMFSEETLIIDPASAMESVSEFVEMPAAMVRLCVMELD